MEDIFVDFTVSILKLNKLVQKIKTHEIEKYGLKSVHVMCIYYLNKNPNGLTAKELSELTLEDKAAISRALKTMHEKGYAAYDLNGRNSVVKLTTEGKAISGQICKKVDKAVSTVSVDFSDSERNFFYKSLDAIVNNLKNYYKELVISND